MAVLQSAVAEVEMRRWITSSFCGRAGQFPHASHPRELKRRTDLCSRSQNHRQSTCPEYSAIRHRESNQCSITSPKFESRVRYPDPRNTRRIVAVGSDFPVVRSDFVGPIQSARVLAVANPPERVDPTKTPPWITNGRVCICATVALLECCESSSPQTL